MNIWTCEIRHWNLNLNLVEYDHWIYLSLCIYEKNLNIKFEFWILKENLILKIDLIWFEFELELENENLELFEYEFENLNLFEMEFEFWILNLKLKIQIY